VRPGIDVEAATDLLFGPLIFRRLTNHAPLDEAGANAIAHAALHGLLQ
jgi:hypothetical protein